MRTVSIIVLSIMAAYAVAETIRIRDESMIAEQWSALREHSINLNGKICARKPQLPYILGCEWYPMATDSVFEKCEINSVDFILFTETERMFRPKVFFDAVQGRTGNYKPFIQTEYCLILNLNKKEK